MSLEQEVGDLIANATQQATQTANPTGQLGTIRDGSPQEQIDRLTVVLGGLIEAVKRVAAEVDKAASS